jgi:hypothetical protein
LHDKRAILPVLWRDPVISGEVKRRPQHALIFLSAYAVEEHPDIDEEDFLGSIWVDGIIDSIMKQINQGASLRNLALIGPHRGDVIGYEIQGSGIVWSALSDRGEAKDMIAGHVNTMINPNSDLSDLAAELVDAFIAAANEDAEGSVLTRVPRAISERNQVAATRTPSSPHSTTCVAR